MTVVYKYQLNASQATRLELPVGATPLRVDIQSGSYCLWAMVDPDAETETRTFEIFGTGHPMPDFERRFINTFLVNGGSYVFHAFERIEQ